jgi:isopenicillin-N epimerase
MDRRDFLLRTGLALGGAALTTTAGCATAAPRPVSTDPWELLRGEFELSREEIHLSQFLLAPHPRSVREAIELYRRAFDENPVKAYKQFAPKAEAEVCRAAAAYLEVKPEEIALTDSTTMGLGLVYSGLRLREGDEIITSTHEHYADQSLRLREERTGVVVRRIPLYDQPDAATGEEIVQRLLKAITPRTRALAVTWVLSSSGVKLPIRAIADALARVNAERAEQDRVLLCVDGVHGLGVEDASLPQLGCDFFISGCHKWLFGPRGTGFIWGKPHAWRALESTLPTFHSPAVRIWARDRPPEELPPGPMMTRSASTHSTGRPRKDWRRCRTYGCARRWPMSCPPASSASRWRDGSRRMPSTASRSAASSPP